MSVLIPGRADVSNALQQHIDTWQKGKGGVVFLSGSPASGKSYILDTLEQQLKESAIRVDCRQPIGSLNVATIQPLQPFGLAIERLYQSGEQVARKRLAMNIGMSLLASLPIAGEIFYAIKSVRQDVSEYKRETAALAQKRKVAIEECIEALERIAEQTPFVLLVDDAHWSDSQSIEVLKHIASDASNKLLIIWAFEPRLAREHNPALTSLLASRNATAHSIALTSMLAQDSEQVLRAIAPTLHATPEQLQLLHERSGGLPGVLVEYVRYLERTGEIASDGTIKTDGILTSGVQLGSHPSTDLLLHEVPEEDAILLAMCAAEGREFTVFLLAALTNTDAITTIRTLRRIEKRSNTIQSIGVRTRHGVKCTTYRFTSDLAYTYFLHYASYEERKHIHQRIIEVLNKEHNNADVEAVRTQLAAVIAAHGVIAEDSETINRMLSETDPDLVRGLPLAEFGIEQQPENTPPAISVSTTIVDVEATINQACSLLIDGKAEAARSIVQGCYGAPAITPFEQCTLLCIEARCCITLGHWAEAERIINTAELTADGSQTARVMVLNVLATLEFLQGNAAKATKILQDAATLARSANDASVVLTASNTLLIEGYHDEGTQSVAQKLKRTLADKEWVGLARDLGLAVLFGLFVLGTTTAVAQEGTREARRQSMESAHPTPDANALLQHGWPKVPFVQGRVNFPSQFVNADMIANEQDAQPMQNESSIAINPTNPRNLIGSAVDYRGQSQTWVYYSTNGGDTWTNVQLGYPHPGWRSTNDPSVCYDHLGRGYLCYGGFNTSNTPQFGENGVYVSITNDGGNTWKPTHIPVIEHRGAQTADSAFEDKYYIHADTAATSPHRGNLYIPWKRVINADSSTQIVIAKSTDRGITWTIPVAVSDRFAHTSEHATFGQSFPLARTGPDGSVHVVWNSGTESAIRYARSTNAAQTFTSPRILHTYNPFGEKREVEGVVNSRVKEVVRAECYPTLSVDNTGGSRNGWLYLAWAADNPPNVYFSRSADNGDTWSAPKIVHSDTANDQFWSWITVDPTSGDIAVMYFDSRDDSSNILVNCYVSLSTDGGDTWADRRVGDDVNDLRNNPFSGRTFAGDYSGCDFYNGIVYPSWVDMRFTTSVNTANSDVFTAIVNTRAPSAPATMAATTIASQPTKILIEWSAVSTRTFGQPLPPSAKYVLYRDGTVVTSLSLETLEYLDTNLQAYREYSYQLRVVADADSSAPRTASAFAGGSRLPGAPILLSATGSNPAGSATMHIVAQMPRYRLDNETPLVNMATLVVVANADTTTIALSPADTGQVLNFDVRMAEDGWYHVSIAVEDADANRSAFSDSLVAFAGNLHWAQETFDTMPNYLIKNGAWGIDNNFAYSAPNSLSDSPYREYDRSRRDTILLYPLVTGFTPEQNLMILRWRVAAFIDPSDTAFLELKRMGEKSHDWQTIAWWNSSVDERWADTTKGSDAWRAGQYATDASSDTLQLRLRFRSNVTKQSDGLYFDDVTWDLTSSVEQPAVQTLLVHPLPAAHHVLVAVPSNAELQSCVVQTMQGTTVEVPWQQSNYSLLLDVRDLPGGLYMLRASTPTAIYTARILVVH